jgi:rhamnosyltransferase
LEPLLKTAGIVVLYNSQDEIIDTISSYLDQIDRLFVVDNSEVRRPVAEKIVGLPKTEYIGNGKNLGVAKALNIGAAQAMESGYDFLLTMDQDSRAPEGMVPALLACCGQRDLGEIGIISPFHITKNVPAPKDKTCREVLTVMTSGNLLNLRVFKKVGPFMEQLFIDYVDHEYCLRLHEKGYKVLQCNGVFLEHTLGDIRIYRFLGLSLAATNHSVFRRYYMTRNRFFLLNKYKKTYPLYCRSQLKNFWWEFLMVLLFEKRKIAKIRSIIKGYRDYKQGVFALA